MGIAPLVILALAVAFIGATLGQVGLWIIAGISFLLLIGLLVVMYRKDQFFGPGVLFSEDDAFDDEKYGNRLRGDDDDDDDDDR